MERGLLIQERSRAPARLVKASAFLLGWSVQCTVWHPYSRRDVSVCKQQTQVALVIGQHVLSCGVRI